MHPPRACDGLDALAREVLAGTPNLRPAVALAPHVARMLVTPQARKVQSTLDGALQAFVLDVVDRQLAALDQQHVADAAVLVVDNASGEVLAYAGNSGESSSARYVDGVKAARQAGSTLKPFLYELAIEQRLLTAASLLDDSPVNLVTPGGLYVPQNYDHDFKGLVSLRTALSGSLNVPAVRTLTLVGPELFAERLRALGFEYVAHDGDYYGYSLALGSAEVSLWQLTNAYRALANGGVLTPLKLTPGGKSLHSASMDRAASYIVADILSDRSARSITFGLASPLAGALLGGSQDRHQQGHARQLVRGLFLALHGRGVGRQLRRQRDVGRVGGDGGGTALARGHELSASGRSRRATRATRRRDRCTSSFEPAVEASREELFLAGTAVAHVEAKAPETDPSRASSTPGRGEIIAMDPDIPARAAADAVRGGRHRLRRAVEAQRRTGDRDGDAVAPAARQMAADAARSGRQ